MRKNFLLIQLVFVFAIVLISFSTLKAAPSSMIVRDIFGRSLNSSKVVLVDWEGQLANPAIRLQLVPPADAAFPATLQVSANGARLYFDILNTGSTVSSSGPFKSFTFTDSTPQSLYLAIFPDHDTANETYTLTLQFDDTNGVSTTTVPIDVIDQDLNRPLDFHITIDYSQDQSGFFGAAQQAIVQRIADDWAYFIADMKLDTVSPNQEFTYIWTYPDAFHIPGNGNFVLNTNAYNGYLVYFYGITCTIPTACPDTSTVRSGGAPTGGGTPQSSNGVPLSPRLWRSGDVNIETQGNYNTNGWFLSDGDDDWLESDNYSNSIPDLNSIAHHELGHAIGFNNQYPAFVNGATLTSPSILAYHGGAVPIDGFDHFNGVVDRQSKYGIFGNEYNGNFMPNYRWLITKLDVLLLQTVGYKIRQTSAFLPLTIKNSTLPPGLPNVPYQITLLAEGGLPSYQWSVSAGSLPPGFTLDSFTGELSGTLATSGMYPFTIQLCDNDSQNSPGTACKTKSFSLVIAPSPANASPVRNVYTTHTPVLTWNALTWATGYEVQVDDALTFAVPDYKYDTLSASTLSVTTDFLTSGVWYWRVRGRKIDGTWGAWSAVESFTVNAP